jgi:hypothetical protein
MVYANIPQSPAEYCKLLASHLPPELNKIYLVKPMVSAMVR